MWDIVTWEDGTIGIAWWLAIVLLVVLLALAGRLGRP